ncbi:DUF922 domain-containing protein [Chitinophaga sancti]|uniref:DUF922 domain-containing protein n=2 Tax=Chitinophaga sancti TaxID=1004 RepID=A0A1K1RT28_9BACT|nr:hypothetical protein [Chitinophaga sancti]WQD62424.1 hypothetical protein U0033_31515 [Chitinophaga sancti]WQG92007.1 hypothetical protein SR876_10870 [Chitinophaga sancti]SFW75233.1 hypothetical protein SAMN05661012_04213 [Chitinophaga sancti]
MKRLIFNISFIFLTACSSMKHSESVQKEEAIQWTPTYKLSWTDYKGKPGRDQDEHIAARTNCRFGIKISGTHVDVTSEFICARSNVRPGQQTPSLLAHEQLHFDLCEVYARLLRKELGKAPLTNANVAAISRDAFLKYYDAYKQRQIIYDHETRHGLNQDQQKLWNAQVATALADLAAYAE